MDSDFTDPVCLAGFLTLVKASSAVESIFPVCISIVCGVESGFVLFPKLVFDVLESTFVFIPIEVCFVVKSVVSCVSMLWCFVESDFVLIPVESTFVFIPTEVFFVGESGLRLEVESSVDDLSESFELGN